MDKSCKSPFPSKHLLVRLPGEGALGPLWPPKAEPFRRPQGLQTPGFRRTKARASASHSHVACLRFAWAPASSSRHPRLPPSVWPRMGRFFPEFILILKFGLGECERTSACTGDEGARHTTSAPPQICPRKLTTAFDLWFAL